MWKRVFLASAIFAGAFTTFCGGDSYATAGNTATITVGDDAQTICVETGAEYVGSHFAADITGQNFVSQIVIDDFDGEGCKTLKLPAGEYSVTLNTPMGTNGVVYTQENNTLRYSIEDVATGFLNSYGAMQQTIEGTGEEESNFPKVFAIGGECTFHKDGTITGETCIDKDGNSHVGREYIDTGTMLFSRANADKDFEIYFEIASYSATQIQQASIFNAKLEDESRNYPGFVLRIANTDASSIELTSRLGTSNASEKKTKKFTTSAIAGKGIRIARINKRIKYSIDGAAYTELDNFTNFSNYFNQITVFGASFTPQNTAFRKFDGTLRNMYIRIGTYEETVSPDYTVNFDANGGTVEETSRTLNEFAAIGVLPTPAERDGYEFAGWNTAQDGSGVTYTNATVVRANVTLYAQWISNEPEEPEVPDGDDGNTTDPIDGEGSGDEEPGMGDGNGDGDGDGEGAGDGTESGMGDGGDDNTEPDSTDPDNTNPDTTDLDTADPEEPTDGNNP